MVGAIGLVKNMNHSLMGSDSNSNFSRAYMGASIVIATIPFCIIAHWLSWHKQRRLQRLQVLVNGNLWLKTFNVLKPTLYFQKKTSLLISGQMEKYQPHHNGIH